MEKEQLRHFLDEAIRIVDYAISFEQGRDAEIADEFAKIIEHSMFKDMDSRDLWRIRDEIKASL